MASTCKLTIKDSDLGLKACLGILLGKDHLIKLALRLLELFSTFGTHRNKAIRLRKDTSRAQFTLIIAATIDRDKVVKSDAFDSTKGDGGD